MDNHAPDPGPPIPPHRAKGGIFISRGTQVSIPPGGLKISLNPGAPQHPVTLHLGLNLCPTWCDIAIAHLKDAQTQRGRVIEAWHGTDDNLLGEALLAECQSGMQAVVAGATAVDSLYSALKTRVGIPAELRLAWRQNGTARYKQITEIVRRAFLLKPRNAVMIRRALEQVYRFRGWAVHPPDEARQAVLHPDLRMGTEWRFVAFSFPNSRELARASLSLVWQAASAPRKASPAIESYCIDLAALLGPTRERWEASFGALDSGSEARAEGAA